jgi:hypothetical protein
MAFDVLQTRVLQRIVTAGGGGFGPLQQSLAALPISKGGLGITTATSLLPCAYLASVTQTSSLQSSILGPSDAPLVPAALAARTDYCALVPDFDAALFEDTDFVHGKVQAQLSKPLCQRKYREIIDDPARSDRDRAVLTPSCNRELLTGCQLYQFPTYNRPWLLSPFAVAFSTSFSFQFSKRDASAPIV